MASFGEVGPRRREWKWGGYYEAVAVVHAEKMAETKRSRLAFVLETDGHERNSETEVPSVLALHFSEMVLGPSLRSLMPKMTRGPKLLKWSITLFRTYRSANVVCSRVTVQELLPGHLNSSLGTL